MRKISNIVPGPVCRSDTKYNSGLQANRRVKRPIHSPLIKQCPLSRKNRTWSLISRTQPIQPFQTLDGPYRN